MCARLPPSTVCVEACALLGLFVDAHTLKNGVLIVLEP